MFKIKAKRFMDSETTGTREIRSSPVYLLLIVTVLVVATSEILWINAGHLFTNWLAKYWIFKGMEPIELKDRLSIAILLALIPVCSALPVEKMGLLRSRRIMAFLEAVAVVVIMISVGWMTYYRPGTPKTMWEGFGIIIAATTSAVAVLIALSRKRLSSISIKWRTRYSRIGLTIVTSLLAASYFTSIMSFPNGITSVWAMRWSLNELIAPLAGTYPLLNFTSQYSSLLGYPLVILKVIASKELWPLFVLMYINILIILQFLMMGHLIKKMFPKFSYVTCLFIPCSIALVQLPLGRDTTSSIIASLTATPSRTFLPILGMTVCTYWASTKKHKYAIATGFTCAITAINNLEFGIWFALVVSTVAIASYLKLLNFFERNTIRLFFYIFTSTIGVLLIITHMVSKPYDYRRHIIFLRAFGKDGFGNIAMPKFGLFVFVFVIFVLAPVLAAMVSLKPRPTEPLENSLRNATLVGFIVGPWSIFSLLYYAGRSTNAGQLQVFLIPLSLCIFAIIRMTFYQFHESLNIWRLMLLSPTIVLLLLIFPFSLIIQAPNPLSEIDRWSQSQNQWTLEAIRTSEVGLSLQAFLNENSSTRVGYFGNNGNLIEISIGIENLGTINYPYDLWMSPLIYDLLCKDLHRRIGYQLLVPVSDLPENEVQGFCAAYGTTYTGLDPTGLLHVYNLS